jgi:hypothetical protein
VGPTRLAYVLAKRGVEPAPSRSTVYRALGRQRLIEPPRQRLIEPPRQRRRVEADSRPGKGAAFRVLLPQA